MDIEQKPFLDVLGAPDERYVIPVFQRVYSWSTRQCEELWDDAMRAGDEGAPHFMGLLLFVPEAEAWSGCSQLDVIDGQQRMTTLTLLLSAFGDYLEASAGTPAQGIPEDRPDANAADDPIGNAMPSATEIRARYLVAGEKAQSAKLVLSQMDRDTLALIVGAADAGDVPEEPAQRLLDNKGVFSGKMHDPSFDPHVLWRGLQLLEIACVTMSPQDSPQLVFESLNSKGMPLTTADRVRNLIIASTAGAEQERLYEQRWVPLEEAAANASEPQTVTGILEAWLAARYRKVRIFDRSDVYGVFKTCLREEYGGSLESLLSDVSGYAERFLDDADFREGQKAAAEEWTAGKPEKSVSEFKMFGD